MSDSHNSSAIKRPVILCVLDGWGVRDDSANNAIAQAATPNWDRYVRELPMAHLKSCALHVGLPEGQMGNSEVGHMNLGAGRVVLQELPKIDKAIREDTLKDEAELADFVAKLKDSGGVCHLLGLLSPGGVHSHQDHMVALAKVVSEAGIPVRVHGYLDGRDTPPKAAKGYIEKFEADIAGLADTVIATISGRYYAMDRDNRWERVSKSYLTMTDAVGERFPTATAAVDAAYAADTTDEFVLPSPVGDYHGMTSGDGILMANFRADRAREILAALLDPAFDGFARPRDIEFAAALGMALFSYRGQWPG